jgi:hypothetical protein
MRFWTSCWWSQLHRLNANWETSLVCVQLHVKGLGGLLFHSQLKSGEVSRIKDHSLLKIKVNSSMHKPHVDALCTCKLRADDHISTGWMQIWIHSAVCVQLHMNGAIVPLSAQKWSGNRNYLRTTHSQGNGMCKVRTGHIQKKPGSISPAALAS